MADQLTNVVTDDAYTDACQLGPDQNVRQLRFSGYNNAYIAQLYTYARQPGSENQFALAVEEYVYAPDTGDVFGPEVAGVRFRSYNPGQPAAIYAVLAYQSDPPAAPTPAFPPGAAPIPGSAYTIVGNGNKNVAVPGTPVQPQNATPCSAICIRAKKTNTGLIYVGLSTVNSSNGYQLSPGDAVSFAVGAAHQIWIDADVGGEGITWFAVG